MFRSGGVRQPTHDLAGRIAPHRLRRTKGARVDVRESDLAGPEERVKWREAVVVHLAGRLTEGIDAYRRARVEPQRAEVQQPAPAGPDKRMVDPTVVMGPTSNLPRCIDATGVTRVEGGQGPQIGDGVLRLASATISDPTTNKRHTVFHAFAC